MRWGALSEIYVPFKNGQPDFSKAKSEADFLISKGVNGFYVNGIGAESLALSIEERKKMLESVLEASKGRYVIQNITDYRIDNTLLLASHARDSGATHVLISQHPVYSLNNLMQYYNTVAEKTDLPIILYNEKLLGQVLTPVTVSSVLTLENFVGYKDSTRDIVHLLEVIELMPKGKDIIAGSDSMIYETYVLGGSGIISLLINPFPELVIRIVDELENKNYESALLTQIKINRVRSILKSYGFSSGYREACRLRGIDCGDPYLSTEKMTEKQREELEQKLMLEGLI